MVDNSLTIRRLSTADVGFEKKLASLLQREILTTNEVTSVVRKILGAVRHRGDQAVIEYTKKFDGFCAKSVTDLLVTRRQMEVSLDQIAPKQRQALTHAAERIRRYHEKQKQSSWHYEESDGSVYGQKISPLKRVGIYVPGGKANYPSSLLMLAIPAQVAGVTEIIVTVPTAYSDDGNLVFAAAALAGVSQLYTIGGAQAIGALAYGTETVPRVDKITGPGNIYVTAAKK